MSTHRTWRSPTVGRSNDRDPVPEPPHRPSPATKNIGIVVSERSTPGPREVFGRLLARAAHFDLAVASVRLVALDFRRRDIAGLQRCRVLLGSFDNAALLDAVSAAAAVPSHEAALRELASIIASNRVEIRSASVWRWFPDLCIARGPALDRWFVDGAAGLVGYLGLGAEPAYTAPRLACLVAGRRSVGELRRSFEPLWEIGHDVRDVVLEALRPVRDSRATADRPARHAGRVPSAREARPA